MTAFERFDRVFADVLTEVAEPAYPDYIDDVLDRATRHSQRPAWTFPERWLPVETIARTAPFAPRLPWRALGIAALLALLVAALIAVYIGTQRHLAPPFGPADNGRIAYILDGDIYTRSAIDAEPVLVVGGEGLDVFPFFSRDGSRLAFARIDQEATATEHELDSLYIAKPDGTGERRIFGPVTLRDATWSPRGDELAVLEQLDIGGERLSIVNAETGAARVVPFDGEFRGVIAWRPPDGNQLVFMGSRDYRRSFYVMNTDGSEARAVTGDANIPDTGNIVLTPDGRSLVYTRSVTPLSIRILDLESGHEREFGQNLPPLGPGQNHAGNVHLSADGKTLVFGRYWDEDFIGQQINSQVWAASIDGDGSDAVPLSPVLRTTSGQDPFVVLLAPDGSQVLLHRADTDESWVTDFAGLHQRVVDWGNFWDIDWQRVAS